MGSRQELAGPGPQGSTETGCWDGTHTSTVNVAHTAGMATLTRWARVWHTGSRACPLPSPHCREELALTGPASRLSQNDQHLSPLPGLSLGLGLPSTPPVCWKAVSCTQKLLRKHSLVPGSYLPSKTLT